MINIIETTKVAEKGKGDALTAADINKINSTVNKCVEAINSGLTNVFDVCHELEDHTTPRTLSEAALEVPKERRHLGLKLRFLESDGITEMFYIGTGVDDSVWGNEDNWSTGMEIIDGGVW